MTNSSAFSTAFALLAALLVVACGGEPDGGEAWSGRGGRGAAPTPSVEVVQARLDALPLRERLTGTVRGAGQVAIYPQATGPITEVYVDDGTVVTEGQPLARIRSRTPGRSSSRRRPPSAWRRRRPGRRARA